MFATRDYIMNVDARDLTAVRDKLLQIPNMNTTGRLPAVLLVHVKMQARATVSDERLAAHAPVDNLAIARHIELYLLTSEAVSDAVENLLFQDDISQQENHLRLFKMDS